ncbi:MAG: hypothetical protein SO401_00835 [Blautia sp.]|nr:hypothetical protein [Blautia sp.]
MSLQFLMNSNRAEGSSVVNKAISELVTELLHCTIPVLYEIREEWPKKLKEQGASSKIIAFCEKLVDLALERKGNREKVSIESIKIFPWFEKTPPDPEKIKQKEEHFQKTGLLPSEILLDGQNYLLDGYISYLLAEKYGLEKISVRYGKRLIIRAYHRAGEKLYSWKLPEHLADQVSVGDKVLVSTVYGHRYVTVAAVEEYGHGAVPDPAGKVLKCKKKTHSPAALCGA